MITLQNSYKYDRKRRHQSFSFLKLTTLSKMRAFLICATIVCVFILISTEASPAKKSSSSSEENVPTTTMSSKPSKKSIFFVIEEKNYLKYLLTQERQCPNGGGNNANNAANNAANNGGINPRNQPLNATIPGR